MPEESLKQVLMRRDQLTSEEADEQIKEAAETLKVHLDEGDLESAFYICEEAFGLEPDYNEELLDSLV